MILLSLLTLLFALALLSVTLWNALAWPRIGGSNNSRTALATHALSILIPARDEEENIAACLDAALAQEGQVVCEVLVYNDHSLDQTARIVSEYAEQSDARVRLIESSKLPAGWCGKPFACSRLAEAARGEWLLFIDADTRLSKDAAARMISEAEERRVTLLSCWPRLEAYGFWESVLMPLLNFVVFTLYPAPLALRRRLDASLGLAHGSCMLARSSVYKKVGGHAAVRDQLFEDVRLAQVWRERGQESLCLDGQRIVSVRMYHSLAEIWNGFQKNFFPAFRRERSFWTFLALHTLVFLLPFAIAPLAFLTRGALGFALAAACVLVMRVALAIRFGHPLWSVLLHPPGEVILIALGISSWLRCRTGRGVEWKGRRYHAGDEAVEIRGGSRV